MTDRPPGQIRRVTAIVRRNMLPRTVSSTLAALIVAISAAGCSGGTSIDRSSQAPVPRRARSMRFIGRDEVLAASARNAEDLLQRVRPQLLEPRAAQGGAGPAYATPLVYVNDSREGGLEVLHLVPANSILDITYLTPLEANIRFTGYHPGGAIVIRANPRLRTR
jgi:hypothetical protein